MILNELAQQAPAKQLAKVFEQYYGQRINVDALARPQAQRMLNRVRATLNEHRASLEFHRSERDPGYLKLVMIEQALAQHLQESVAGVGNPIESDVAGSGVRPRAGSRGQDPDVQAQAQAAREQQKKQSVAESLERIQRYVGRALTESEVQQAQVVLAAQDIVDTVQKMIEDMTETQFKEIPALVDTIKNQVGTAEAEQYNQAAVAALGGLVENLQTAKQQLEAAQGILTGQPPVEATLGEPPQAPAPAGMPEPEETEPESDLFGEPTAGLGRERR